MEYVMPTVDEAEVAVIGAGPAGAAAAAKLAQLGHDVVLIDKDLFPRDKPCGDGLTRSAVALLQKLGLEGIAEYGQPIEGLRVFNDFSQVEFKSYKPRPDRPKHALCVPRLTLDKKLLDVAVASGARFINAQVDGPVFLDERADAVMLKQNGASSQIKAKFFIAADGATSRMRRQSGLAKQIYATSAYAVRQYCTTENSLDPFFDVYMPLQLAGTGHVGYGWVFPIQQRLANIGVSCYRGPGVEFASINHVLTSFMAELNDRDDKRLGSIKGIGSPLGSPVGMNFSPDQCQVKNIIFVGDAARTTDPLNGEGITYALHGGEMAAHLIDKSIRRGTELTTFGTQIETRFPRLGQDISVITRSVQRSLKRKNVTSVIDDLHAPDRGMLIASIMRLMATSGSEPDIRITPVWQLASEYNTAYAVLIEETNRRALIELRTTFPFATELLHGKTQDHAGPVYATTLILCAQTVTAEDTDDVINAALALELLALFNVFTSQVVNKTGSNAVRINNSFSVLLADFAVSRALCSIAKLGAGASKAFGSTESSLSEGQMLEVEDLYNIERSPERYFEAIESKTASLLEFSARLGAELAGVKGSAVSQFERYGRNLGMAFQISDDLVDLLVGDEVTDKPAGSDLKHGNYTLPVIYALGESTELRELLRIGNDEKHLEQILETIKKTGGIERAADDCRHYVEEAKGAVGEMSSDEHQPLIALAELAYSQAVDASSNRKRLAANTEWNGAKPENPRSPLYL